MLSSLTGINDIILILRHLAHFSGSCFDRCFYAGVGTAPAEIAVHSRFDLRIGGLGRIGKEGRGRHNLARLAITTLRHIVLEPCLLYRMVAFFGKAFDGGDGLVSHR